MPQQSEQRRHLPPVLGGVGDAPDHDPGHAARLVEEGDLPLPPRAVLLPQHGHALGRVLRVPLDELEARLLRGHGRGVDIDGELAKSLANDLADDKSSRDGITKDLFALTANRQKGFAFKLEGKENYRGREVYRLTFKPRKPSLFDCDDDGESSCWAGEALIDPVEYQPVLVTSWLAKGIPMAVQVLLGTNIKHLGFKVAYRKFDEGLWFPVTYGGEFYVRGLFFYKRTIALSVVNSGFRKSDVTSVVSFGLPVLP